MSMCPTQGYELDPSIWEPVKKGGIHETAAWQEWGKADTQTHYSGPGAVHRCSAHQVSGECVVR